MRSPFNSFLLVAAITGCARMDPATEPGGARIRPRPDALITRYRGSGVTALPDSVRRRFNLDTTFYARFADGGGIPVIASAKVPDEALLVTRDIINHMLLKRPDIRADIIHRGGRVGVMAVTEMTTDIPEQRDWKKPAIDDRRLTLPGQSHPDGCVPREETEVKQGRRGRDPGGPRRQPVHIFL